MGDPADTSDSVENRPTTADEFRPSAFQQAYRDREAALQAQSAALKEKHGAEFERRVSISGVDDPDVKSLAVGRLARNIAERGAHPSQISGEDFKRLTHQSIEQAHRLHDAERDKQSAVASAAGKATLITPDRSAPIQDQKRDYGDLHRTHEAVAVQLKQAPISPERLDEMGRRNAELRTSKKLEATPAEISERRELVWMQGETRRELELAHGPNPNAQQKQERALLDHQHAAEKVGFDARWIGQHLRRHGSPEAELHERDARSAYQTARQVHAQRQNLGAGIERGQDQARLVRQQDQQKQNDAHQATIGRGPLTSEQRANAAAELKQARDGSGFSDARKGTHRKNDGPQNYNDKPANFRPTGRDGR